MFFFHHFVQYTHRMCLRNGAKSSLSIPKCLIIRQKLGGTMDYHPVIILNLSMPDKSVVKLKYILC